MNRIPVSSTRDAKAAVDALFQPEARRAFRALKNLGLTVVVFQGLLGEPGLTFYVPFATAVLLFRATER